MKKLHSPTTMESIDPIKNCAGRWDWGGAYDENYGAMNIDPDSIMPPSMLFLQIMELVALGNEERAWEP